MKFARQIFLVTAITLLFTSCKVTAWMWRDSYSEKIDQFLVSSNGEYTVFLSAKYHYIFSDQSNLLKNLLLLDRDLVILLNTKKTHLEVDSQNNLSGHLDFESFDMNLTSDQLATLMNLGFTKSPDRGVMSLSVAVSGSRYASGDDFSAYSSLLNEKYHLQIYRVKTTAGDIERVALTPLTITADGVIFVTKTTTFLLKQL